MNRGQPSAGVNEPQQRLFLLGRDFGVIRINEHAIETGELGRVEVIQRSRVVELKLTSGEDRLQLVKPFFRAVMAVVAEEEDAEGISGGSREDTGCAMSRAIEAPSSKRQAPE